LDELHESAAERRQTGHLALEAVAGIISTRLTDLEASAEARRLAEERYLDGRSVLFPDAAAAWDACLQSTRQSLGNAGMLAEIDGTDLTGAEAAAPQGERGLVVARAWLRTKADVG
jgi:hypothetical protein